MKFILVPILMILVLFQTFSKWLVVAEYSMNKNFIAKNLCVNRAKPKMHCNGKCQMMKRLAEEEKQNSSNNTNNSSKTKVQELVLSDVMNTPTFPLLTYVTLSYNEEPPVLKHDSPISSIFHPPAVS
jgi:hypothetical protein